MSTVGAVGGAAITNFSKLKLSFDGTAGPDGLEEFLEKFDLHRKSLTWSDQEAFICLTMAVKDEACKVLSKLRIGNLTQSRQNFDNLVMLLRNSLGATFVDTTSLNL